MLTIEGLRALGANVDEGMARCMNNEAFYLRLVNMALTDSSYDSLRAALDSGDKALGFEEAHKLKGMIGNLSLTPIFTPVSELTEILRNNSGGDTEALYAEIVKQRSAFLALANS